MGTSSTTKSANSADINRDLVIQFEGANSIPFRAAASRASNTFWGVLGKDEDGKRIWRRRGWKISAAVLGVSDPAVLPSKATITDPVTGDSVEVTFDSADENGEPLLTDNGQPKVVAKRQTITLPGVHAERVFHGSLSLTKDGNWNTNVSANSAGGGSGPKALGLDDL